MPDRVLNTLLHQGPHFDKYPMRVSQKSDPEMPPVDRRTNFPLIHNLSGQPDHVGPRDHNANIR
jgi:hypothetical protein